MKNSELFLTDLDQHPQHFDAVDIDKYKEMAKKAERLKRTGLQKI